MAFSHKPSQGKETIMTMSETTMCERDDWGAPASIPAFHVASMFRRADPESYDDARREFFIQVNLNPFRTRSEEFHQRMEDAFDQWFTFDYHLDQLGLTPFAVASAYARDENETVGERGYAELCETSRTNFASWFWVREANAAESRIVLEDVINGGIYGVRDFATAAAFDGAKGGAVVVRIARVRGAWRMVGDPLFQARKPDSARFRLHLASCLRTWDPKFIDLVRLLFGCDPHLKLDLKDMRW